jgi:polygalacturonase
MKILKESIAESQISRRRQFILGIAASSGMLSAAGAASTGADHSSTPKPAHHVVNILDFGAVSDGRTLSTAAIQAAINACAAAGGGKVFVPPGKYLTGPFS